MTKRRLLFAVCALLFGGAAHSQSMTTEAFYNTMIPKVRAMSTGVPSGFFGTGSGPGYYLTSQTSQWPLSFTGYSGTVTMGAQGFLSALTTAAAKGALSDSHLRCFYFTECTAVVTTTSYAYANVADSGRQYDLSSPYGVTGRVSIFASGLNVGTANESWQMQASQPTGMGAKSVFGEQFNSDCSASSSSGFMTGSFKTMAEALTAGIGVATSFNDYWGKRAPACVPFKNFVKTPSTVIADAVTGLEAARVDKINPARFFQLSDPITFTDLPSTGGTTGGGTTPAPTNWDVAPSDDETSCSIVNIPCNLRKLFVPQVDWAAEWQEMQDVMSQKMPFAYVSWLGSADGATSQDIGIDLCAPVVYDTYALDWCNTGPMLWWRSYGVAILFAFLYISYLTNVIQRIRA